MIRQGCIPFGLSTLLLTVALFLCGGYSGGLGPACASSSLTWRGTHLYMCCLRCTRPKERAHPPRFLNSLPTSSCRACVRPPYLHNTACSTVIFAPQPSQFLGMSSGAKLYWRRRLLQNSSAKSELPLHLSGMIDNHIPPA